MIVVVRHVCRAAVVIGLASPFSGVCEERLTDRQIPIGMSQVDVLRRAGPPKDKLENEASRREVWVYGDGKEVTFLNGVVIGRRLDSTFVPAPIPHVSTGTRPSRGEAEIKEPEGIFAEIMREADAEAAAGAPKP